MKLMKVLGAALAASALLFACGSGNTGATASGALVVTAPDYSKVPELKIWTQEGEADGAFQFILQLTEQFEKEHKVKIAVENKDTETLREDFQTASLAGGAPDIVWTVNDHAGPFVQAGVIAPLDVITTVDKDGKTVPYFNMDDYADSAVAGVRLTDPKDGKAKVWGIPVSNGNELMLIYHKDIVKTPPKDTDELIKLGKSLTVGGKYGLVFNQTEPFWLVPWLGGFGGKVFAEDGVTPTLNTKAMVDTLKFLHALKFDHKILPPESDYNGADTLFKEKKAAMIISGDWALGEYQNQFGANLGIARLPKVVSTGLWPAPYTSGKFVMVSSKAASDANKLAVILDFFKYVTTLDNQNMMTEQLIRLPALKAALAQERLVSDDVTNEILKRSAEQMEVGTPMPAVREMRFNWDAMRPKMSEVLANKTTPEDAAKQMQELVDLAIKNTNAAAAPAGDAKPADAAPAK